VTRGMSASRTSSEVRPPDRAEFAATASEAPSPASGSGLMTRVQPWAKLTPSGPATISPGANPASSTASSAQRPSGLPAQAASSLPPPKRVARPAASTATSGGSAMRVQRLVFADDFGQDGERQHAGLAGAGDDADRGADTRELAGRRAGGGETFGPAAARLEASLRADEEGGRFERPFEDRLLPLVVVEQQHHRGPRVGSEPRRSPPARERVLAVRVGLESRGSGESAKRLQFRSLPKQQQAQRRDVAPLRQLRGGQR